MLDKNFLCQQKLVNPIDCLHRKKEIHTLYIVYNFREITDYLI